MTAACHDCSAVLPDEQAAQDAGWKWLAVVGSWRCTVCAGVLTAAAHTTGCNSVTEDTLPPTSLGALRKETASSITPTSVKP